MVDVVAAVEDVMVVVAVAVAVAVEDVMVVVAVVVAVAVAVWPVERKF